MKRVYGFEQASTELTRKASFETVELPARWREKVKSIFGEDLNAESMVRVILKAVREKGDEALAFYTEALDGTQPCDIKVDRPEIEAAYEHVDRQLLDALKLAAQRIREFHEKCLQNSPRSFYSNQLGQTVRPLQIVGIYVPGGAASYPSTVLMSAIPARVAGVKEIIMTTPPKKAGLVPPAILVAADIAGVDEIFKVGGAQAIAALAYGTESVPRVDKICGPGNIAVTLAKKMVYGSVDIDGLEGPSEMLTLADDSANPAVIAADLLAQAEHDPLARVVLVTTSRKLADDVQSQVISRSKTSSADTSVGLALRNGVIAIVDNLAQAIVLANAFAPEHLSLMMKDNVEITPQLVNAGCIFVGGPAAVALGDYIAGPSHVLPTGGTARFASPLGVNTFLKTSNVISLDEAALRQLGPSAIILARSEGLEYHARALELRLSGEGK